MLQAGGERFRAHAPSTTQCCRPFEPALWQSALVLPNTTYPPGFGQYSIDCETRGVRHQMTGLVNLDATVVPHVVSEQESNLTVSMTRVFLNSR